jgi:predicted outer membrane repeat protein
VFTVTDLGDAGAGSGLQGDLRYCLNQANTNAESDNQITFDPSLAGTITLTQGVLTITKDVDMVGPGASLLTISGNKQSGVFDITDDPAAQRVQISGLTIADGVGVPVPTGQGGGGLYNAAATVTLTDIVVTGNSVQGSGGGIYNDAGTLILESSTVSGNSAGDFDAGGGVFDQAGTLVIDSSTISNNQVGVNGEGGGIGTSGSFLLGPVTITRSTIAGNSVAGDEFGPGSIGGGIYSVTSLTVSACTISNNTVGYLGGGFFNVAASATFTDTTFSGNSSTRGGAGLFNDNGRVTLIDCTISGNISSPTDGFGSGVNNNGHLTLSGCTLSGNSAYDGGGLYQGAGMLSLTNCTVSENTAAQGGGGIYANQAVLGLLQLTSVTLTDNSAGGTTGLDAGGGGIWLYPPSTITPDNRAYLDNTLVAGNTTTGIGPDVSGTVLSMGYNLVGQRDGSQGWISTDFTGTSSRPLDPRLGPLQNNGGPTLTHAVLAGSPAFEAGDLALRWSFDQRGTVRNGSHTPDIGAFQAEPVFSFQVTAPAEVTAGEPFAVTVTALDFYGNTASTFVGSVRFTSTDLDGVLPHVYKFTSADGGVHSFSVTLGTLDSQTLQVTDLANNFHTGNSTIQVDAPGAPGGPAGLVLLETNLPKPGSVVLSEPLNRALPVTRSDSLPRSFLPGAQRVVENSAMALISISAVHDTYSRSTSSRGPDGEIHAIVEAVFAQEAAIVERAIN